MPHPAIRSIRELSWTMIPIENFKGADFSHFLEFFKVCELALINQDKILLHCRSGRGRTGMFLAAFLIKYEGLCAEVAIKAVRSLRPLSIETREQELCLKSLESNLMSS